LLLKSRDVTSIQVIEVSQYVKALLHCGGLPSEWTNNPITSKKCSIP